MNFNKGHGLAKLRFNLFLKSLSLFLVAVVIIFFLLYLDKKYEISKKLSKKLDIPIAGHEIKFPAMNDTVLVSLLMLLILTVSTGISYQLYYKYSYEKEKLENKITPEKKILPKRFWIFFAFCMFHSIFDFFYQELLVAFEKSLDGLNFKNWYVWLIYIFLVLMIMADQWIEIMEIEWMNNKLPLVEIGVIKKKEKKEKEPINYKEKGLKFLCVFISTLILIVISMYLGKLPKSIMKSVGAQIGGQYIEFFSNEGNVFLSLLFPIVLIAVVYKFFFPAIERLTRKDKVVFIPDNSPKLLSEKFKNIGSNVLEWVKTIGLAILTVAAINFSISAFNTLQKIDFSNFSCFIPMLQLIAASIFFFLLKVWQFSEEEKEHSPEICLDKSLEDQGLVLQYL